MVCSWNIKGGQNFSCPKCVDGIVLTLHTLLFINLVVLIKTCQQDVRQRLANRAAQLEEIHKANKLLSDWLKDVEGKVVPADGNSSLLYADLSEKRSNLEKFRSLLREIASHSELVSRFLVVNSS